MVEEGEMPLPKYILMHSEAKLDQTKIKVLKIGSILTESRR